MRADGPTCDHCGKVRRRNETFVLRHDDAAHSPGAPVSGSSWAGRALTRINDAGRFAGVEAASSDEGVILSGGARRSRSQRGRVDGPSDLPPGGCPVGWRRTRGAVATVHCYTSTRRQSVRATIRPDGLNADAPHQRDLYVNLEIGATAERIHTAGWSSRTPATGWGSANAPSVAANQRAPGRSSPTAVHIGSTTKRRETMTPAPGLVLVITVDGFATRSGTQGPGAGSDGPSK